MEQIKELVLPESLKMLLDYEAPEGSRVSITDICPFDEEDQEIIDSFITQAIKEYDRS